MQFLANENFPRPSTLLLREQGCKVKSIQEECPGISDEDVLKLASNLNLIILTFDKDYGELIFRYSLDEPPAVIFFRDKGDSPEFAALALFKIFTNPSINFTNCFSVIEEKSIRQRFYQANSR